MPRGTRIADGGNDNQKQASDVDNFAVQGVDLLIISPREAEPLTPAVERIHRKGTPVIVLDREIAGDAYTCFIGASNLEIGREAGKFIAERLQGKGRIVEIEGIPGATPTQERRGGMHEAIAAHPGLEVVLAQPGDYKRGPAQTIMENALQAHPRIDIPRQHAAHARLSAIVARPFRTAGHARLKQEPAQVEVLVAYVPAHGDNSGARIVSAQFVNRLLPIRWLHAALKHLLFNN